MRDASKRSDCRKTISTLFLLINEINFVEKFFNQFPLFFFSFFSVPNLCPIETRGGSGSGGKPVLY